MNKKFYEATEVEIIFVQAENIIVTSTSDGHDGDPDNTWLNFNN